MSDLNHPCKDKCSGWKQGHDLGFEHGMIRGRAEVKNSSIKPGAVIITREQFREAMEYGLENAMTKKNMLTVACNYLFGEPK